MPLKKIWISKGPGEKNRYALSTLGGILGILALLMVLIVGGTFLTLYLSLPKEASLGTLCIGAVVLGVVLALGAGRRSLRESLVFFLTQDDRLYMLDSRTLASYRRGVLGFTSMTLDTQKALDRLAASPTLPPQALEILTVKKIREYSDFSRVSCLIRRPTGETGRWEFCLPSGYPDEDLLRFQLERRQGFDFSPEK